MTPTEIPENDYNYYPVYEYFIPTVPDTRSRWRKAWHKVTMRSFRRMVAWRIEKWKYDHDTN